MSESSRLNQKEHIQPFSPNKEVVLYSFSEQKPKRPLALEKILDFFQPKKNKQEKPLRAVDFPEYHQSIEIMPIANTTISPAFNEEVVTTNPDISQAMKIVTNDFPDIDVTLKLVTEANIPHPNTAVVHAIQEQLKREGIKNIGVVLLPKNNQSELKVELEFKENGEIPQKILITDIE